MSFAAKGFQKRNFGKANSDGFYLGEIAGGTTKDFGVSGVEPCKTPEGGLYDVYAIVDKFDNFIEYKFVRKE